MYDIVIIGGGIVGLATALKIKAANPKLNIALCEKENSVAQHQTGNNSGVIHAGVYYKPGSLKAQNCTTGYNELIDFCKKEDINFDICGKLIIATREDELERLENLYQRGIQNGLKKINKITAEQIKEYEPHATGIAAIHVPYTGIIDFKYVCNKINHILIEKHNVDVLLKHKVKNILITKNHAEVITNHSTLTTKLVVNTAGLYSDKIAALNHKNLNVKIIPFRGEYYEIRKDRQHLVKNLIYPVPDPAFPFLGVHYTRKIKGGIEAGPNAVFAFKREGYKKTDFSFKEFFESIGFRGYQKVMFKYWKMGLAEYYRSYNKNAFTRALQRLVPEINKGDLIPGGSGVRAQACDKKGNLIDDFLIIEDKHILNVLNAPSPAATASLAIGEEIANKVQKRL